MPILIEPYRECPRFPTCSVNHCPVDPEQHHRLPARGDKQPKCTMEKGVRLRIAAKYPDILPKGGMTGLEWAATQAFAKLPAAVKDAMKERLRVAGEPHQYQTRPQNP